MRPRIEESYRKEISLAQVQIPCLDCGEFLHLAQAHVPTSHQTRQNKVHVEAFCFHCDKYKYLEITLPGVNDNHNWRQPKIKRDRPCRRKFENVQVSKSKLFRHPKCHRFLDKVRLSHSFNLEVLVVSGRCEQCDDDNVILLFTTVGNSDLSLFDFWIVCKDCGYDVFLDDLSFQTMRQGICLIGIGTCKPGCGPKTYSLVVEPAVASVQASAISV